MQTWTDFLADIRADLQDTTATPRWADKLVWLYTKDAIRDYSTWFPLRLDRVELSPTGDKCSLPLDYIEDIQVESPLNTFLEKRQNRPGTKYKDSGKPISYFVSGGSLYLNAPTDEVVYLTYFASHPVPASESDPDFAFTVPDADLELIRLYVKAKLYVQMRGKQAALDRFKVGSGSRDDNPIHPEVDDLMGEYLRGVAQRTPGGVIVLYRSKSR